MSQVRDFGDLKRAGLMPDGRPWLFIRSWPQGNKTLGYHAAQAKTPDEYARTKEAP